MGGLPSVQNNLYTLNFSTSPLPSRLHFNYPTAAYRVPKFLALPLLSVFKHVDMCVVTKEQIPGLILRRHPSGWLVLLFWFLAAGVFVVSLTGPEFTKQANLLASKLQGSSVSTFQELRI